MIFEYLLGTAVTSLTIADLIEQQMHNQDTVIEPPSDTVSIIVPSLNEESTIERCLQSIRNQSIIKSYPSMFETILVDSGSTDNTVELAKPYIDKLIIAGKGKLTARNLATLNSNGNIIVSVDADSIYYPIHWLNTLLKPLKDLNTVAVVGSTIDSSIPYIPKQLYILAYTLDLTIIEPKRIVGRNSAYWKHLFYRIGMFDETINQQDIVSMLQEEEHGFGEKLSAYGNIVYKMNAPCQHLGGEKHWCRTRFADKQSCNKKYKIGIERFGELI